MSALVLGKRSSSCFFEELHHHPAAGATTTPPPPSSASKRPRFGASPPRLSPSPASVSSPLRSTPEFSHSPTAAGSDFRAAPLGHLRSLFPSLDEKVLERTLEASGNDLDSAIYSLNEVCMGSAKESLQSAVNIPVEDIGSVAQPFAEGVLGYIGRISVSENPSTMDSRQADGSKWTELFVREMMDATNIDDARSRASRALEVLEKSIMEGANAQLAQSFCREHMMLKEQVEGLLHDNNILKRAVAIQHERQKESDDKNQELQHVKQLVAQYQEQIRMLEINNYALSIHLRQAQQSSSIPGRFHPDVF